MIPAASFLLPKQLLFSRRECNREWHRLCVEVLFSTSKRLPRAHGGQSTKHRLPLPHPNESSPCWAFLSSSFRRPQWSTQPEHPSWRTLCQPHSHYAWWFPFSLLKTEILWETFLLKKLLICPIFDACHIFHPKPMARWGVCQNCQSKTT